MKEQKEFTEGTVTFSTSEYDYLRSIERKLAEVENSLNDVNNAISKRENIIKYLIVSYANNIGNYQSACKPISLKELLQKLELNGIIIKHNGIQNPYEEKNISIEIKKI